MGKKLVRFIGVLLAAAVLSGCRSTQKTETVGTAAASASEEPEPTAEVKSAAEDASDQASEPGVVEAGWHFGYVGSDINPNGFVNAVNPNGTNYSYTDVIELGPKGTKVTFSDPGAGITTNNAYVVSSWTKKGNEWVLDTDGVNIAGGWGLVAEQKPGESAYTYTYISSHDNECIRFCYNSGQKSADGQIDYPVIYRSQTDEAGTVEAFLSLNEWIAADRQRTYYEELEGKTINFLGDSYFAGYRLSPQMVWPAFLAAKYDMVYKNYGINGATISDYVTNNKPMTGRYADMEDNDPDIVVVEGGRNDYKLNVPIGEDGSTDTKTFKGALRTVIAGLQKKYPNAQIICITVWEIGGTANETGAVCSDYGKAMMQVCEDMGVSCINAMDAEDIGVDMTDVSFRLQYCLGINDISHLNLEGMKLAFPAFERHIAELYSEGGPLGTSEEEIGYPADFSDQEAVEKFLASEDFLEKLPKVSLEPLLEDGSDFMIERILNGDGLYKTMQGGCTDGTYVYLALNGPKIVKDGAVQNILFKIDMSNWEIVAQSEPLGLDHANSITYNSRLNQLIVSHCYNGTDHDISFVDPETLTIAGRRTLDYAVGNLVYYEPADRYVLRVRQKFDFAILDADFQTLAYYEGHDLGLSYQSMDCDDNYIYIGDTGVQNAPGTEVIKVYRWDGELAGMFRIGTKMEHEALFHAGDDYYITFNMNGGVMRRIRYDWDILREAVDWETFGPAEKQTAQTGSEN